MRRALIALPLLLLAGQAAAEPAQGSFVIQSSPSLPEDSQVSAAANAGFLSDIRALTSFSGHAGRLSLTIFELHYLQTPVTRLQTLPLKRDTWQAANATVTVGATNTDGFLGLYPADARITIDGVEPIRITSRAQGTLKSHTAATDDTPDLERYHQTLDEPHLYIAGRGVVQIDGGWAAKVMGPTLRFSAAEGTKEVETGEFHPSPGETIFRWVYLEVSEGSLSFQTRAAPFEVIAPQADATWRGKVTLSVLSGWVEDDSTRRTSSPGEVVSLTGELHATLNPTEVDGRMATLIELQGDLASTSLRPDATAWAPVPRGSPLVLVLVLGGALILTGGLAGTLLGKRRHAREDNPDGPEDEAPVTVREIEPGSVEDFVSQAREASVDLRWGDALKHVRRARSLAPTSIALRQDEAFYLAKLNQNEEAYAIAQEAARLSEDGEDDIDAAHYATKARRPDSEVEAWVLSGLRKTPSAWRMAESEKSLTHILKRGAVRGALRTAKSHDPKSDLAEG